MSSRWGLICIPRLLGFRGGHGGWPVVRDLPKDFRETSEVELIGLKER